MSGLYEQLLLFYGVSVWGSAGQESGWMNSILFLPVLLPKLKEVVRENLHTLFNFYMICSYQPPSTHNCSFSALLKHEGFCKVKEEIQTRKF